MNFPSPLVPAKLIKRYKRFLADVELEDTSVITVHCPNTGTMKTCSTPGSPVLLSVSNNPKRKYPHTFEMICESGHWVGVNTMRTNALVAEGIEAGIVTEFTDVVNIKKEVKVSDKSRLDLLVEDKNGKTYIEVKNCSMAIDGIAMFPDAVTSRGAKHLDELMELVQKGERAVIFFLIQRGDTSRFAPAQHIDPVYANKLRDAKESGVMLLAYQAEVTQTGIQLARPLPIDL